MITDDDIYDFMEHAGVKGMKWGVRKARSRSGKTPDNRTPEQKSADRKELAFKVAKASIAVGVGALVLKSIINQNRSMKMGDIRRSQINTKIDPRFFDSIKNIKMGNVPKTPKTTKISFKSEAATLASLRQRMSANNKAANGDLKKWYERSQTPIHLREYLKVD